MKKIALLILVSLFAFGVQAQDMSKVDELTVKLQNALKKAPGACGVADIDTFIESNKTLALGAVQSAESMKALEADNADVSEWIKLGAGLKAQIETSEKIGKDAEKAAKAVKDMPKMKAIGAAKSLKWATDLLPITIESLKAQSEIVAAKIK